MSTFVCLQDELPPQDGPWPADGVPNLSDRAKWAAGNFLSYREAAGPDASFVHIPLPDRSVAESLDALDDIVCGLRRRIENPNPNPNPSPSLSPSPSPSPIP